MVSVCQQMSELTGDGCRVLYGVKTKLVIRMGREHRLEQTGLKCPLETGQVLPVALMDSAYQRPAREHKNTRGNAHTHSRPYWSRRAVTPHSHMCTP